MMSFDNYQDRFLTCRDCGQEFTFTAGEQEFYASRGLTNSPGRCPDCRAARRNNGGGNSAYSARPREQREQHDAICASCGRPTTVPFIPREDRPVYCSDCFQAQRASRSSSSGYSNSNSSSSSYDNGGGYSRGRDRDRSPRRDRDSRW